MQIEGLYDCLSTCYLDAGTRKEEPVVSADRIKVIIKHSGRICHVDQQDIVKGPAAFKPIPTLLCGHLLELQAHSLCTSLMGQVHQVECGLCLYSTE